jgi:hypothetical protein
MADKLMVPPRESLFVMSDNDPSGPQQPPSHPTPEEALGLVISTNAVSGFKDLHDRAVKALKEWSTRRDRTLEVVTRLEDRNEAPACRGQVGELVCETYRAGLRVWLHQVCWFFGHPVVGTADDLRAWCALCFRVLDVVGNATPRKYWGVEEGEEPDEEGYAVPVVRWLEDADLFRTLLTRFPDQALDPSFEGSFDFSPWADIAGDYDEDRAAAYEPQEPPEPTWLLADQWQAIIDHGWRHLRRVAYALHRPYPPEPEVVRDVRQFRIALDTLMSWAFAELERCPVKDGGTTEAVVDIPAAPPAGRWRLASKKEKLDRALTILLKAMASDTKPNVSEIAREVELPRQALHEDREFRKWLEKARAQEELNRRSRVEDHRRREEGR